MNEFNKKEILLLKQTNIENEKSEKDKFMNLNGCLII